MPTYDYKCPICDLLVEVQHSISELDNPSEETVKQISCNEHTCPKLKSLDGKNIPQYGTMFKKQVSVAAFNSFGSLPSNEKKKVLQKRSNEHFKREIHERKMFMDGKTGKQA